MLSQCSFLTERERRIIEYLKDEPKQRVNIITYMGPKTKTTTERLLKRLEEKKAIFCVQVDGSVFYKRNIFTPKIMEFFNLADMTKWKELQIIKDEIIKKYPNIPFESIVRWHRENLETTKPELKGKGILKILKAFEKGKTPFLSSSKGGDSN